VRVIILGFVLALAGSLPQQGPPRDTPARRDLPADASGAISGRVYAAATGAPLQGAIVSLVAASEVASPPPPMSQLRLGPRRPDPGPTAVTDAFGRFRVEAVSPGTYRLVVMPSGYRGRYLPMGHGALRANDAGRPITIQAGQEVRNADVALTTGAAIEGRVVDEAGEPLSRVPVFAARLSVASESPQRVSQPSVITDDLGRYRVYGLEPGTYIVGADGHFVMPVIETFNGRIYSSATRESEPFLTTYHPSETIDDLAQPVRVGAEDVSGVDIMLRRTARFEVSGTVVDSQGAPASTRVVLLRGAGLTAVSSVPFSNFPLPSNTEGRFHFPALEPGAYRLLVGGSLWPGLTSVNGRTEFADVPVTVGTAPIDVTVVTQPGIGLTGRMVFPEGAPSSPLPIKIAFRRPDQGPDALEIPATMGDDWRFFGSDLFGPFLVRVSSLPRGWVVKAVTLAGADITDVPTAFSQQHDHQLEIVLSSKASTVEGDVSGEETGRPLDASVYVFSQNRASWTLSSPRTVRSDVQPNGRFSVPGLAGGHYYAIAIARAGFRIPQNPGAAFFELLSKDATPFVIGDDERRTFDMRLWYWPE
jgi:hypothetical protein